MRDERLPIEGRADRSMATVDVLTERIGVLETILDSDHSNWRDQTERQRRDKE